jgi:hypothetical protein
MARRGRKRQLEVEARYWELLASGVGTVVACRGAGNTRKMGTGGALRLVVSRRPGWLRRVRSNGYLSLLERQRTALLRGAEAGGQDSFGVDSSWWTLPTVRARILELHRAGPSSGPPWASTRAAPPPGTAVHQVQLRIALTSHTTPHHRHRPCSPGPAPHRTHLPHHAAPPTPTVLTRSSSASHSPPTPLRTTDTDRAHQVQLRIALTSRQAAGRRRRGRSPAASRRCRAGRGGRALSAMPSFDRPLHSPPSHRATHDRSA